MKKNSVKYVIKTFLVVIFLAGPFLAQATNGVIAQYEATKKEWGLLLEDVVSKSPMRAEGASDDSSWYPMGEPIQEDGPVETTDLLDFSKKEITVLPAVIHIPKGYKHLDFSKNEISKVPQIIFGRVTSLDLSKNKISHFPDGLQAPYLTYIVLKKNPIEKIDADELLNLFPKLGYLDVRGTRMSKKNVQQIQEKAIGKGRKVIIESNFGPF